jgi:hypothetical protein
LEKIARRWANQENLVVAAEARINVCEHDTEVICRHSVPIGEIEDLQAQLERFSAVSENKPPSGGLF